MANTVNTVNVDKLAAEALQTVMDASRIYHDNLPENGSTYPMLMYTDITETPALHADGKLWAKEHILRVTIITNGNSAINALKQDVEDAMVGAGFLWQNTTKTHDKNEYYTSLDFSYSYLVV